MARTICHEGFRIQIIRIHQTGIQHPCPKRQSEPVLKKWRFSRAGQCAFPVVYWNPSGESLFQPPNAGWCTGIVLPGIAVIRQSTMMPNHTAGGHIFPHFRALQGSCCGVVNLWAAQESLLKFLGGFPNVVGIPQQLPSIFFPKGRSKEGAPFCGPLQVLLYGLLSAILPNVCIVHNFCLLKLEF